MQEDVLLVRQTLSGDEKAYHRLFIKYQKVIYAQILSMVHSPADAEELTADVFQKAYQNLSSLRQPDKFFFWIVKIARNHCQNWLQRHKKPFLSLEDVPVGELPSTDSAEEELLRQEKYQKVLEALDTLPDVDRELMKGFYFEDASYDTLQKRHGLSKKAVAMRLVKARRKVREKVEKMLSGILVFPWRDVINKLFLGGIEAMKISATTKLVTVWAAILLIVGGIIVSVWHTKPPKQAIQKSVATQSAQEMPTKSFGPSLSKPKPFVNSVQKPFVSPPVTGSLEEEEGKVTVESSQIDQEVLQQSSETDEESEKKMKVGKLLAYQEDLLIQRSEILMKAGKRQSELVERMRKEGVKVKGMGCDNGVFYITDGSGEKIYDPVLEELNEEIRRFNQQMYEIWLEIDRIYPGSVKWSALDPHPAGSEVPFIVLPESTNINSQR